jgi:hypothetical protein
MISNPMIIILKSGLISKINHLSVHDELVFKKPLYLHKSCVYNVIRVKSMKIKTHDNNYVNSLSNKSIRVDVVEVKE